MVELFEKSWYFRKILILVEILKNLDFCRNLRKILIFGWNFRKISILVEISNKSRFWKKVSKISILVEILDKPLFWSKFLKI